MQWIEEEESEEAPGWYFGKVESIADGLHCIVYSDQATERIDLTKVKLACHHILTNCASRYLFPLCCS